jgi:hypothetical protein
MVSYDTDHKLDEILLCKYCVLWPDKRFVHETQEIESVYLFLMVVIVRCGILFNMRVYVYIDVVKHYYLSSKSNHYATPILLFGFKQIELYLC